SEPPPDQAAEGHRDEDVEQRQAQALGDAELGVLPVQHAEIEDEQQEDEAEEEGPHPGRLAQNVDEQKIDHGRTLGFGGNSASKENSKPAPTSRERQARPARGAR